MHLMRILPAIVATGVIVAGVVLWRLTRLSRLRWIVAAFAAYGAVAFTHATLTGLTLHEVLAGHGLFQILPRVLQGAFVGAFVVLPVGWIVSVVRAGIPRFHEGSRNRAIYQAVALTICVGLVLEPLSYDTSSTASASDRSAFSPAARTAQIDHSLRALEGSDREIPRDRWDPAAVVHIVGTDPQQLFAWAQENSDWIPYHGVLRGAAGVLMDGQGNSIDRSLMLAALLEKAGHVVRLAHGQLTREQAVAVLPGLIADRSADFIPLLDDESPSDAEIASAASAYELNGAAVVRTLAVQDAAMRRLSSELSARVSAQATRLMALVPRPDPVFEWRDRLEAAVAAVRDHWWVQLQVGPRWIDFDLLDEEGTPLTAVDATFDPKMLDDALFHDVVVRVVAEQWTGSSVVERTALEHRLRPAALLGQSIVLQFMPAEWQSPSATQAMSEAELHRAVDRQEQWWAGLRVGREVVASVALLDRKSVV